MKKILLIFGTRPEAVKMAPLWKKMKEKKDIEVEVCSTGQHREMLTQILNFFQITPEYSLGLMKPDQTLFDVTADGIKALEAVLEKSKPDIIAVQGDTTTAFIGALAGFYKKIKIAHIEAGLRTNNKFSPFPEEINRTLVGHMADYHFPPTAASKTNLEKEGITENIHVVGNTVIDALYLTIDIIKNNKTIEENIISKFKSSIPGFSEIIKKRIILVTGHRRESFGEPFKMIFAALKEIAEKYPDVCIIYPVHLNPNVRKPVHEILAGISNIYLIEPLDYPEIIWLMDKSYMVLTDSGGIQEEAPSLGKPVLVMRDVTERMEGVHAGTAKLVGSDKEIIVRETIKLLDDKSEYDKMSKAVNPYGDGKTSELITEILSR